MGGSKPIYEINPDHALVTTLKKTGERGFVEITPILFKLFIYENDMKKSRFCLPCVLTLTICTLLGVTRSAQAHVEYYDLNQGAQIADLTPAGKAVSQTQYGAATLQDLALSDPAYWNSAYQAYSGVGVFTGVSFGPSIGGATVNVDDVTDFGWAAGTRTTLGDSHKVDFFNFRLQQDAVVNIAWTVSSSGTAIDSGFSLYRGLAVYQGHDDTPTDPLNPVDLHSFTPIQNQQDTGTMVDAQGIVSPFRDTMHTDTASYLGQFNALGGWSMANSAGNWSALQFLQAVNNQHTRYSTNFANVSETLSVQLAAGNYTIAAGGALLPGSTSFGLTNLNGQLVFNYASPVPVPAALWLFGSALVGFIGFNRRKSA